MKSIRTYYDVIYLSPHLDDAALSCGGQIYQQTAAGESVLMVTLMAGDPPAQDHSVFAQFLHEQWQLETDFVAQRRAEDVNAGQILGADLLHWPVPDCIYRRHPTTGGVLYPDWPHIVAGIHAAESGLVTELATRLATLPDHGRVVVPLTVGHHVDHQITRLAAEQWQGNRVWYYEDYPYVRKPGALDELVSPHTGEWQSETILLAPGALQAKIDAVAAYASQVSTLFNGRSDLASQITAYTQSVGGERIWRRRDHQ